MTDIAMKQLICLFVLALSSCLLLLGGCRDKHEPVKPTVAIFALR